jgi:hypothetical protein
LAGQAFRMFFLLPNNKKNLPRVIFDIECVMF